MTALAPYRVLDLTDARAELSAMVLAGLGADVIKVEPPGGSASRHERPLVDGAPPERSSLRFHAFNRGKRSVVLDLEDDRGRADFLRLVASADFIIENAGAGVMAARGLGFEQLRLVRTDLVYVAISPFGQDGPYANHSATDLTIAAMGGVMALNGDADRRPVRVTVPQTWHHAAVDGALAAMVAHHRRVATGDAQYADVSVQASVFWTGFNAMIAHAIQGFDLERDGTTLQLGTMSTPLVYPALDGEVVLVGLAATMMPLLPWMVACGAVTQEWVDAEDWTTWDLRMLTGGTLAHDPPTMRAALIAFTRLHTKADLFTRAFALGVTIAPVNTAADVMTLDQLTIREFWKPIVFPDGRTLRAPGPFVRLSATPVDLDRPAPGMGQHTDEVLGSLGSADRPTAPLVATRTASTAPPPLPLAGVKVADFSWIGVGPISAKALADHGATVIHIETENPADRLRMVGPFKDGVAGVNRSQFFGSFNTSKMSLALNLKSPEGLAIARRLIEWADVCLDSFTAGTMEHLGLGYEVARELNPSIIMASTCLMGQTGPLARLSGYGYHAAAISGFYEITGWNDRAPAGPFNAYTDAVAPRFLATTLMAALDHRRRTGEGQFIDQAQMESALHFLAPELLNVQVTGANARRSGNESPTASPHDVYPCAGADEWCAIAVETDAQWHALRTALSSPAWATDPALDTLEGRLAHAEMIDAQLAAFTRRYEPRALMDLLQSAGVPAGMVQRSSDHLEDPQLRHREFFRRLDHPEMGEVPYEGHSYRIAGYDNGPRFAAPCLGEHSYEVLSEVLGLSDEVIAEAMANGAIS
jgi:crotonobetainyl-CoA:carnitine CoA-transferase CaiB-like acyl-CoA transferase